MLRLSVGGQSWNHGSWVSSICLTRRFRRIRRTLPPGRSSLHGRSAFSPTRSWTATTKCTPTSRSDSPAEALHHAHSLLSARACRVPALRAFAATRSAGTHRWPEYGISALSRSARIRSAVRTRPVKGDRRAAHSVTGVSPLADRSVRCPHGSPCRCAAPARSRRGRRQRRSTPAAIRPGGARWPWR